MEKYSLFDKGIRECQKGLSLMNDETREPEKDGVVWREGENTKG